MNTSDFLALLQAHRAFDSEEHAHLTRTQTFVSGHPRYADKHYPPGHVTASAWVINPDRDRVLLTHHRKLDRWFQLGGHLEGDANIQAGARREALEESGLLTIEDGGNGIFDVDVHLIPSKGDQPEHYHYDIRFAFIADPATPLIISSESRDLRWVALSDVIELSEETSLVRMIAKTREGWI